MTRFKRIAVLGTMVLAIGATTFTAFAATNSITPSDIISNLTNKTVEEVIAEKNETNKTFGTMAIEADKFEEFKSEMVEAKKQILLKKVEEGTITQEEADRIIALLEENQTNCDGTGSAKIGQKNGAGFGMSMGMNQGQGRGQRQGQGNGQGKGLRNGSCQGQ